MILKYSVTCSAGILALAIASLALFASRAVSATELTAVMGKPVTVAAMQVTVSRLRSAVASDAIPNVNGKNAMIVEATITNSGSESKSGHYRMVLVDRHGISIPEIGTQASQTWALSPGRTLRIHGKFYVPKGFAPATIVVEPFAAGSYRITVTVLQPPAN